MQMQRLSLFDAQAQERDPSLDLLGYQAQFNTTPPAGTMLATALKDNETLLWIKQSDRVGLYFFTVYNQNTTVRRGNKQPVKGESIPGILKRQFDVDLSTSRHWGVFKETDMPTSFHPDFGPNHSNWETNTMEMQCSEDHKRLVYQIVSEGDADNMAGVLCLLSRSICKENGYQR